MDPRTILHFAIPLLFVVSVDVSNGTTLNDSSILTNFRRIFFGKTICCATPMEVFFGISLLDCIRQCFSLKGCTVISYQQRSLQCKLFDIDSEDSIFQEEDPSFVMAYANQWSEELISPCSRHLCSESTRCAIRSNGTAYCAQSEKWINQWKLIYETDDTRGVVSGREDILISTLHSASVRVYVPSWNQTFNIDVTIVESDKTVVCSQSLFQLAKKSWNTFSKKATRVLYMFCSSGFYHLTRYHVGGFSQPSNPEEFGVVGMKWFTRYCCQHLENHPIYCHNKEGHQTCGSFLKLESAIRQGAEVRIFAGNTRASHVLEQIFIRNGVIGAQFLRQLISVKKLTSDNKFYRKYQSSSLTWVYSISSSDGTFHGIKWNMRKGEQIYEHKDKGIDWFTDMCWSAVYSHNQNGDPVDGSENRLRASVLAGKRVRLVLDGNVAGEPDSLLIYTDGHVTAQLLNRISLNFKKNAYWIWRMISSTGFQIILKIYVGSCDIRDTADRNRGVRWYADTRPWRKLLVISTSGAVITGSKYELRRSLKSGGMLRLVVTFPNNTAMAFSPNNIEYYGGEVSAQFVRYIGHVQKSGSTERIFPTAPYWNFIMITTEGTLTSSLWDVRQNDQVSINSLRVTSVWYVN